MLKRILTWFVFPSEKAMASGRLRRFALTLVVFPLLSLLLFFAGMALVEVVHPVGFFASVRMHLTQSVMTICALFFALGPGAALLTELAYVSATCPRCGAPFGGGNPLRRRSGSGWLHYLSSVRACPSCGAHCRARLPRGAHFSMAGIAMLYAGTPVLYLFGGPSMNELRAVSRMPGVAIALACIFGLLLGCSMGLILRRWLTYELAHEP